LTLQCSNRPLPSTCDVGNARDFLWRSLRSDEDRAALTVVFAPGSDGLQARFPIVVAA